MVLSIVEAGRFDLGCRFLDSGVVQVGFQEGGVERVGGIGRLWRVWRRRRLTWLLGSGGGGDGRGLLTLTVSHGLRIFGVVEN